ncbi:MULTISPECIES: hydrolase [unclassified Ruminococcus]|uniref:hydrolase n=1 Tax=unclassified Ruminococcus TaxID=2608920 RepID=UPI002109DB5D|nr:MULTISPECIES: hydrolase [unclassified Ruminococcus]MCQ4021670.1 hydrolase [Ruminococcus sp. zg-924]MCQ4114115.1 hydrolase [Ruminococcus sp. zg-921]
MDKNLDYKEEFCRIFSENVKRHGAKELLEWLCKTDFFTAPASTKFHCACPKGLVMHSLSVYDVLVEKHFDEETDSLESFTICALLHDLCKAQYYKVSTRNVKNEETGNWEKVPFYAVDDYFPYGHGEKSVFLIERFMKLRIEEAMAIRWHMGGFEDNGGFTIGLAYQKYPLAVKLHLADLESTYLREKNTSVVNN